MATIDADAHVIETDRTWEYLDESDVRYKPVTVAPTEPGSTRLYWIIDGKLRGRRTNIGPDTNEDSREMMNVAARLHHMDELGVDIQVLFPSVYTRKITEDPRVDLALGRSYNRWLADIFAQGEGRLRWVAVPPLLDLTRVRGELEFAKEHGACGILMRGFESDRHLSDPYFHPLYEVAQELDLAVCVHAGSANPAVVNFMGSGNESGSFLVSKIPVVSCFHSLVLSGTPSLFPHLRFGFLEASAQWVPYVLHDLVRRMAHRDGRHLEGEMTSDILRENRLYVACQTDDDLPYILQYTGEDNLVMGTDYGHADTTAELRAMSTLRERRPVAPAIIDKILDDNARTLYGLGNGGNE